MRSPRVLDVAETRPRRNGARTWPDNPVEVLRALYPRLLASARAAGAEEDVVQEALVETLSRHPDFRGIAHPLGYTKAVLFRLAYAKRLRRIREVPLELQERLETISDPADRVADRLRTRDALMELGPRQRACIVLRYVEGLDDDAIAAVLGVGPSTVRSQITRAREHLRAILKEDERA